MVTRELLSYIQTEQTRGLSRDAIEYALIHEGWTLGDVKDAFLMAARFHLSKPLVNGENPPPPENDPTRLQQAHLRAVLLVICAGFVFFFCVVALGYKFIPSVNAGVNDWIHNMREELLL
jgi:hypothetical protein